MLRFRNFVFDTLVLPNLFIWSKDARVRDMNIKFWVSIAGFLSSCAEVEV